MSLPNAPQAANQPLPTEVPSLMVPLQGRPMLVPNLAVAEIVPFNAPVPVVGKPQWYLGQIMWRGVKVPVVSLVQLRGEDEDIPPEARIAVFNGLGGDVPFYGVISHGIPRLVRVRSQDIEPTDGMYTPVDDAFVAVGGELAIIPNLLQLETLIAGAWSPIDEQRRAALRALKRHHSDGWFRNNYNTDRHGIAEFMRWMREKRGLWPSPKRFPLDKPDADWLAANRTDSTLTWIGHVTFLFQHRGLNILTDPVFGERASPLAFAGPRRYMPPAMHVDHLPPIDLVLLSHNHYDHLDRDAAKRITRANDGQTRWLVPLKMADWFRREGIENVIELDWWDDCAPLDARTDVKAWFVPAQHFSGRGVNDRNATLWGGWVLEIDGYRLYFAGDTGYGQDFADIGDVFGGFDLSLIPIGAYEPQWFMNAVHVKPEDSVRIHRDVKSRLSVGMHWGTFILTDEPVDEPPRRLGQALQDQGVDPHAFVVMRHGETRKFDR